MQQQRLPSIIDPPVAFAHRGARAHAPENTVEAFALAIRLGATGLESDVWITADGVPVLDHDGIVKRRGRKIPISAVSRAELPSHICDMARFVDEFGAAHHVSLDVKDPAAFRPLVEVIRSRAPALEERLWLCHHDWKVVASWRPHTTARLVDSTRLARLKEGPERRAADLAAAGVDCINMHHSDWTGGLVTLFHRFDVLTLGWDMQQDHVLRAGLRMGLDGVFSDHVDRMTDAFADEIGGRT
ncbi:MAG: glycerophosphodiester phosphodiesterase [Actinomycetota bacterium]